MKKIMVIGCGGAGKSTFCRALHEKLGLPLVHMDQVFWSAGWVEPDREVWQQNNRELIAQDSWILDGNYGSTMDMRLEAADTIIFLAYSRWVCLHGILTRWWRYRGKQRPDIAEGCPDRMEWQFMWYVFRYNDTRRPGILNKLASLPSHKQVHVFRRRREGDAFLAGLDG